MSFSKEELKVINFFLIFFGLREIPSDADYTKEMKLPGWFSDVIIWSKGKRIIREAKEIAEKIKKINLTIIFKQDQIKVYNIRIGAVQKCIGTLEQDLMHARWWNKKKIQEQINISKVEIAESGTAIKKTEAEGKELIEDMEELKRQLKDVATRTPAFFNQEDIEEVWEEMIKRLFEDLQPGEICSKEIMDIFTECKNLADEIQFFFTLNALKEKFEIFPQEMERLEGEMLAKEREIGLIQEEISQKKMALKNAQDVLKDCLENPLLEVEKQNERADSARWEVKKAKDELKDAEEKIKKLRGEIQAIEEIVKKASDEGKMIISKIEEYVSTFPLLDKLSAKEMYCFEASLSHAQDGIKNEIRNIFEEWIEEAKRKWRDSYLDKGLSRDDNLIKDNQIALRRGVEYCMSHGLSEYCENGGKAICYAVMHRSNSDYPIFKVFWMPIRYNHAIDLVGWAISKIIGSMYRGKIGSNSDGHGETDKLPVEVIMEEVLFIGENGNREKIASWFYKE